MENKNPLQYSVLMSVYYKDNPDWLKIAIESMLNQTIKTNDFVLVEDGALTDELEEVVKHYENEYKDIFNVVRIKENGGLGPALALGVENCKNELIARMDADDYSYKNRIEEELKLFENDNSLGMVGTNVTEFIDSIDNVISNVVLPETNEDIINFSKKRNPFRHPSIVFRKSAVLKAGNYREYYLCEDYDMWIRMLKNGCKCYNIQENYVCMRISEDFYKRRGGVKYLKSILKFKKEQLDTGYFTKKDYVKSAVPHIVVCLMPNGLRDYVYRNFLRK